MWIVIGSVLTCRTARTSHRGVASLLAGGSRACHHGRFLRLVGWCTAQSSEVACGVVAVMGGCSVQAGGAWHSTAQKLPHP